MLNDRMRARMTILMPQCGVRLYGKAQAALYRWTGGRLGGRFGKGPVLLLTTTGRRTGEQRCTSVLYGRDGDRLVVIGSNTGSEKPPAWALNLAANSQAEVQIGRKRTRVVATLVEGSERERLWNLMGRQYEGFDIYTTQTTREFKVFLLDAAG